MKLTTKDYLEKTLDEIVDIQLKSIKTLDKLPE